MVTRRGWTARKGSRSDWISETNLDGCMATRHGRALPHERSDLVDSVRALPVRRVARISGVTAKRTAATITIGFLITRHEQNDSGSRILSRSYSPDVHSLRFTISVPEETSMKMTPTRALKV